MGAGSLGSAQSRVRWDKRLVPESAAWRLHHGQWRARTLPALMSDAHSPTQGDASADIRPRRWTALYREESRRVLANARNGCW